jgi:hypothetical protein
MTRHTTGCLSLPINGLGLTFVPHDSPENAGIVQSPLGSYSVTPPKDYQQDKVSVSSREASPTQSSSYDSADESDGSSEGSDSTLSGETSSDGPMMKATLRRHMRPRTIHDVQRKEIASLLGAWDAASFPGPTPSELAYQEKAGYYKIPQLPWLPMVAIPGWDTNGPLRELFRLVPGVAESEHASMTYAHHLLAKLSGSTKRTLASDMIIRHLLDRCIRSIKLWQQDPQLDNQAAYLALRLAVYCATGRPIEVSIAPSTFRPARLLGHIVHEERKSITLILLRYPSSYYSSMLNVSFEDALFSAQRQTVFPPLYPEDSHGFHIAPHMRDICYAGQ